MTSASTTATSAPTSKRASGSAAPELGEGERERLDAAVDALQTGTRTWSALTVAQRATLLRAVRTSVAATAEDWAHTAAASKGLDARHPCAVKSGSADRTACSARSTPMSRPSRAWRTV